MEQLIFDIETNLSFPMAPVMALFLIILVFVIFNIKYRKKITNTFKRRFLTGVIVFLVFLVAAITYNEIKIYKTIENALQKKNYKIVKGIVEDFTPAPYAGHKEESFKIKDKYFSYSDYEITTFYHQTRSHGGLIRGDGQKIKIAYISFPYTSCLPFVKYFGFSCPVQEKNRIIKIWNVP